MDIKKLIDEAIKARVNAYAPYSKFKVGCALITSSEKIYTGCNIENASYGATICAERVAIAKAISEGQKQIMAIAIYADTENYIFPCGICRQFMVEFSKDLKIYVSNKYKEYKEYSLQELIPDAFTDYIFQNE